MISLKVRGENVRIKKIFKKAWENGGKNVGQNLKKKDGEIGKRRMEEMEKWIIWTIEKQLRKKNNKECWKGKKENGRMKFNVKKKDNENGRKKNGEQWRTMKKCSLEKIVDRMMEDMEQRRLQKMEGSRKK